MSNTYSTLYTFTPFQSHKGDQVMSLSQLSNLSLNASLASTGKKNGVSFTDTEKNTAKGVSLAVLIAIGKTDADHDKVSLVTDEITEAVVAAASEEYADIPALMKKAYRNIQKANVEASTEGWPKVRDPSSIQLIFRNALKDLKVVDETTIDSMFKRYGAKKSA